MAAALSLPPLLLPLPFTSPCSAPSPAGPHDLRMFLSADLDSGVRVKLAFHTSLTAARLTSEMTTQARSGVNNVGKSRSRKVEARASVNKKKAPHRV